MLKPGQFLKLKLLKPNVKNTRGRMISFVRIEKYMYHAIIAKAENERKSTFILSQVISAKLFSFLH